MPCLVPGWFSAMIWTTGYDGSMMPDMMARTLTLRDALALHPTAFRYPNLIACLPEMIKPKEGRDPVTQAGSARAAANRGITVPGNRGACTGSECPKCQTPALSIAAMIKVPISSRIIAPPMAA